MEIKYVHTNIISEDWKKLSNFYIEVFNCKPILPERDQKGLWLDKGTGVKNAHIKGIHLLLPGYGETGPTIEIYEYPKMIRNEKSYANTIGLGHIAFHVGKIETVLTNALENGATKLGELSNKKIESLGILKFIYIRDPEGNIIELQNWS